MKRSFPLALLLGTVALSGCTTLGGNIKGSFDCKAPSGTCAPISVIDSGAVDAVGATSTSIDDSATDRGGMILAGIGDGVPGRTNDRVLKVVFPAHTDGSGIYRDEATARVVVERGGWVSSPVSVAAVSPRSELQAERQAEVAATTLKTGARVGDAMAVASGTRSARAVNAVAAPSGLRELAGTLKAEPMLRLEVGADDISSDMDNLAGGDLPSPEALAAARAGHRIGTVAPITLKASAVSTRAAPIAAPGTVKVHRGAGTVKGVRVMRGSTAEAPKPAQRSARLSADTSAFTVDPFAPIGALSTARTPR